MAKLTSLLLSFLLSLVIFSFSYADNTVSNMVKCRSYILTVQDNAAYKLGQNLVKQYPMNSAGYYCLGLLEFTVKSNIETTYYYFDIAKRLLEQNNIVDQNANLMINSFYWVAKSSVVGTSSNFKKNKKEFFKTLSEAERYAKTVENICFKADTFTCYTSYFEIYFLYYMLGSSYRDIDMYKSCEYYSKASSVVNDTVNNFELTKLGKIDRGVLTEFERKSYFDVLETCIRRHN